MLGTSTLLAGAIQQLCTGDYSQAVKNRVASIGGNDEADLAGSQTVTTGKDLIEKIGQIRKSVAAVQQQIIAPAGFFMPFIPRRGYLFSYLLSS